MALLRSLESLVSSTILPLDGGQLYYVIRILEVELKSLAIVNLSGDSYHSLEEKVSLWYSTI